MARVESGDDCSRDAYVTTSNNHSLDDKGKDRNFEDMNISLKLYFHFLGFTMVIESLFINSHRTI